MNRKHLTSLALASAILGSAGVSGATVEQNRHSGQLCQGITSTDRGQIIYDSAGAMNFDLSAQRAVYCGARWAAGISNTNSISAIISYYDRSTVDSLSCRLEVLGSSGTTYVGPWVYSCATSGGCAAANAAFASASVGRLDLTLTHPVIGAYSWSVRCNLPRRSTSLGSYSGIISYVLSHDAVGF